MHNVISFEVMRALRKKSFWYATIALPIFILAIFGIDYASSRHASQNSQQQTQTYTQNATIGISDETGLILTTKRVTIEPDKQTGISDVQSGKITAFFYYPRSVVKDGIQVYAQDQGISFSPPYSAAAQQFLRLGATAKISSVTHNTLAVQILQKDPSVNATTYKNGQPTQGLASIIAPGTFWLIFLALTIMMSYYTIAATTEEKENRAAEILLTSIQPQNLILGKIISIFTLSIVQGIIIVTPLLIAYFRFRQHITLPGGISLSQIPLDPHAIGLGALFLVFGLALYTGILVGFSALFPSAQEAGRYLILVVIWVYIPLYALGYVISSPQAPIVTAFTYFPLTAPTTVLLRNAVGTLPTNQAAISLAIVIASAIAVLLFAVRAFRYGAMAYSRRISLKELF